MNRSVTFAGLMLLFFVPGTVCLAQYGLPGGDYKETCQNIRMYGERLYAACEKRDGGWRNTSIDVDNCPQDRFINDDGHLRCAVGGSYHRYRDGDDYGGGYRLPPGSYKESCQNIRVQGETLYATCQKRNGGWHDTSLNDFDDCRSPIFNRNGHLGCPK